MMAREPGLEPATSGVTGPENHNLDQRCVTFSARDEDFEFSESVTPGLRCAGLCPSIAFTRWSHKERPLLRGRADIYHSSFEV
jgi:hypothetical protein